MTSHSDAKRLPQRFQHNRKIYPKATLTNMTKNPKNPANIAPAWVSLGFLLAALARLRPHMDLPLAPLGVPWGSIVVTIGKHFGKSCTKSQKRNQNGSSMEEQSSDIEPNLTQKQKYKSSLIWSHLFPENVCLLAWIQTLNVQTQTQENVPL